MTVVQMRRQTTPRCRRSLPKQHQRIFRAADRKPLRIRLAPFGKKVPGIILLPSASQGRCSSQATVYPLGFSPSFSGGFLSFRFSKSFSAGRGSFGFSICFCAGTCSLGFSICLSSVFCSFGFSRSLAGAARPGCAAGWAGFAGLIRSGTAG
jgi:hypothetical protein